MAVPGIEANRLETVALIVHACKLVNALPSTKYCALSLFSDRFLPWMHRFGQDFSVGVPRIECPDVVEEQVMRLVTRKSLQFVGLVFIWIASKIHERRPVFLKDIANEMIPDVHICTRDFAEAEMVLMKAMNFDVRTGSLVCDVVNEFLSKLRTTAKSAKLIKPSTIFHIIDFLYGDGRFNFAVINANLSAAAILAVAYAISIPDEKCNFPLLPWLTAISRVSTLELERLAKYIWTIIFS